ncbi:DUF2130 domain-containing protein [Flavihumibacter petaseus]|uniref:DUF2130 domain-containing protein n=1 Tax=Flavihumibacter petaseus NBRC 106054 TaxID=1220578 RepID=A0A0E9MZE1_9BACT|nr:DUF2130 domain-containing protein [Flavihumibacter petaseus]GAO42984.1 hypothetical protein FPE01S_02_00890 [Flavihumibacter petaseus NBRC 106054]
MPTTIKCPNCSHEFPLEDALNDELKDAIEKEKQELRQQMIDYKKSKEDEIRRKEESFQLHLHAELKRQGQLLEEGIRKSTQADFENRLQLLQQANRDNEEKLRMARQKELDYLRMEQDLKTREAELDIELQKKLQAERSKLSEELRKLEEQKMVARENEYQLRLRELEKQLEDQKRLAEEMKRRAEQGSMQLQGEVQELILEELLRASFPFDLVAEVGKGARGADCILTVRNQFGQECGRIIFESKRTKNFSREWIEKLKADMRSQGVDIAILVTQTLPDDMQQFGEKEGLWICSFHEVKALVTVLRDGILRVFNASKSQENKGDKMHMLYDYLTSAEFSEQWKAIREGFLNMKLSIQRERDAMEKLWKAREKQLEKVLLNAAHVRGSIEGIAGSDTINLSLLENDHSEDEIA